MMEESIEGLYFNWLCAKVLYNPASSMYVGLLRKLHQTEFVWVTPGDDNRVDDGLELRRHFMQEARVPPDPQWPHTGCSVLEMLVAFCTLRASFETEVSAKDWFWKIMENLGLDELRVMTSEHIPYVEEVLQRLIFRTYDRNGRGGMFPMRWPKRNQAGVEIWYQFNEYIEENKIA